jgi:competence protein ComEA
MDESTSDDGNWYEKILLNYRYPLILLLIGTIVIGLAAISFKGTDIFGGNEKIEVITATSTPEEENKLVVEVAGSVKNPGVYELDSDARVEDALISAGGLSNEADTQWLAKKINRAAKLVDGQKVYILSQEEVAQTQQSDVASAKDERGEFGTSETSSDSTSALINLNTASQTELETLWGIGPVYAQKIIEYRPYSVLEELTAKGILRQSTYEKIKNQITI